jgi:uncharacterized protein (DUF2336 family)
MVICVFSVELVFVIGTALLAATIASLVIEFFGARVILLCPVPFIKGNAEEVATFGII